MPIRPGTILLLLVMATAFHRTGLAGENKEQTSLIAGSAYSPTSYGGDRNGAVFWSVAACVPMWSKWSASFSVAHGHYTDYPQGIGRVYFTPLTAGIRFSPLETALKPFIEVLGVAVPSSWGGASRLVEGSEIGAGLRGAKGKFGIEVSVRKLRTGGASMNNFDAAPSELPGLDQYLLGAALVFCK